MEEIGSYLVGGTTPEFACEDLEKPGETLMRIVVVQAESSISDLWTTRHKRLPRNLLHIAVTSTANWNFTFGGAFG